MFKLLILVSLISTRTLTEVRSYNPKRLMPTANSCGGATRLLMKDTKVTVDDKHVTVNGMTYDFLGDAIEGDEVLKSVAGVGDWGWGYAAVYQKPGAYMHMDLLFNDEEAYLSVQGIDASRKPCMDAVKLKRVPKS